MTSSLLRTSGFEDDVMLLSRLCNNGINLHLLKVTHQTQHRRGAESDVYAFSVSKFWENYFCVQNYIHV